MELQFLGLFEFLTFVGGDIGGGKQLLLRSHCATMESNGCVFAQNWLVDGYASETALEMYILEGIMDTTRW